MSLDLPKTSKEMQDWKWADYEPFFEYLLEQEINSANINSWMKYWSDFSELIGEVGTDVYVSTTVDTADEEAKIRTSMGPTTVMSCSRGSVWNTTTSSRALSGK